MWIDVDLGKPTFTEGSLDATYCIITDALNEVEVLAGKPLVDTAGSIFNSKLHHADIQRSDCYITSVVKEKTSDYYFRQHWFKGAYPIPAASVWRDVLLAELEHCQAKLFIPMGAMALWALTGRTNIDKIRGSYLTTTLPSGRVIRVLPTYSAKTGLKDWGLFSVIQMDLIKAKSYIGDKLPIMERNLIIRPSLDAVFAYIDLCANASAFAFDIETTMSPVSITCISLSPDPIHSMSIPLTVEYWETWETLHQVLCKLHWLFQQPEVVKIGHNMTFDIQYIARFFGIVPAKPWFDTMIAHHTCYSELPKALHFLCSIYTHEPYYKDELKVWNTQMNDMDMLWKYNAKDSAVTIECYHKLRQELIDLKNAKTFDYMMELLEPLLYMMLRGVKVDIQRVAEYREVMGDDLATATSTFAGNFGGVNPNSPKQLMELAYNTLGLKPILKRNSKGEMVPTMDEKAITKLAASSPELREVLDIRQNRKLISTYLDMPLDEVDGRLRFSLNATGTETGRLSSSGSIFGSGGNMQNVPKHIRDIIVPDEGMVFTEADLKGAEAMVMAYLINDPMLIELFRTGGNVHQYNATLIFDKSVSEIKADKEAHELTGTDTESMYYKTKKSVHSINYMASWKSISETVGCSAKEAKFIREKYLQRCPNLAHYHRTIIEKLKRDRVLTTPLGRSRIFLGRYGDELWRSAVAFIPQETVAHLMNQTTINLYNLLRADTKGIKIVLTVHDSILVQHAPEDTEVVSKLITQAAAIPLKINGYTFTIPLEIKTGPNWRHLDSNESVRN